MNMEHDTDCLIVASIRQWVAREFEPAAVRAGIPLVADLGLDVPTLPDGCTSAAWWTPMEHAARLVRAGVDMHLVAPGPFWLATLDERWTGRKMWAGELGSISRSYPFSDGFAKAAEMKVADLQAQWWNSIESFYGAARVLGLPKTAMVQITPTRIHFVEEHRCFVLNGEVVGSSPYLVAGNTYEDGMESWDGLNTVGAVKFAEAVLQEASVPPAFVLDVGFALDGRPFVVEANPAWSSGRYGADIDGVLATVRAASVCTDKAWLWKPDPWLVAQAEKKALLREVRRAWTKE